MNTTDCLRPWFAASHFASVSRRCMVGALCLLGIVACAPEENVGEDASEVNGAGTTTGGRLGDDWRLVVQAPNDQLCLVREPNEVLKFSRCYSRVEETWQIQQSAPTSGGAHHVERLGWLWKVLKETEDRSTKLLLTIEFPPGQTPKIAFLPASRVGTFDAMQTAAYERGAVLSPVQSSRDADGNWKVPEVRGPGGARYQLDFLDVNQPLPDGALALDGANTRQFDARLILVPAGGTSRIALEKIGSNTCDATHTCAEGTVCRWESAEQCLSQCGVAAGPYLWACMEACNTPGEAFVVEQEGDAFSFRYTLQRTGFCGTPNTIEKYRTRCIDQQDESVVFCSGSQLFAAGYSCAGNHEELFRCDPGYTCHSYAERAPGETVESLKEHLCVPQRHLVTDISRDDCLAHETHCLEEHDGISLCWRSGGWSTTGKKCENGRWVTVSLEGP